MKKLYKILLSLFAIAAMSSGCSDFLNEEPQSTWGINDFYSNSTEADIALAGIYSQFASDQVYGQAMSIIMESGTDEGYYNRRYNENWTVGLYRHTAADNDVKNLWSYLYQVINLSNIFIEKLDPAGFEDDEFNRYIGEAKFLRAHAFSLLASWFEEVPMPLSSTLDQSANHLKPVSLEELYTQIIEDYTFASEHLPLISDASYIPGRANKMAAHGLMARVYLKMAGYPLHDNSKYLKVLEQSEIIINSGEHSLTPSVVTTDIVDGEEVITIVSDNYRKHFLNYIENVYDSQETLFEISFKYLRESGIDAHGRIGGINGLAFNYGGGDDGYPGAYAMFNTTPVVRDLFVSNDELLRKAWNVPAMQYTASGDAKAVTSTLASNYCPGKFRRWEPADFDDLNDSPPAGEIDPYILLEANPTPNRNFTGINIPVLRYADILLMHAEADNALNGPTASAIGYLDEVRRRAGLDYIQNTGRAGAVSTQELFFQEIVDERLREFCFEGRRKHDLIRWELLGTKLELLNAAIIGSPDFKPTDENHKAFLRSGEFFDASKHMSLPYPLQEVNLNNFLEQKPGW